MRILLGLVVGVICGLFMGRGIESRACDARIKATTTAEAYFPPKLVPGTRGLYVDFMN